MKLIFSRNALEDLERLYSFMSQINPSGLDKSAKRLNQSFDMLQEHPLAGYGLDQLPKTRELLIPFGKGNYIIRYRIKNKQIHIAHIWHSRENRP